MTEKIYESEDKTIRITKSANGYLKEERVQAGVDDWGDPIFETISAPLVFQCPDDSGYGTGSFGWKVSEMEMCLQDRVENGLFADNPPPEGVAEEETNGL